MRRHETKRKINPATRVERACGLWLCLLLGVPWSVILMSSNATGGAPVGAAGYIIGGAVGGVVALLCLSALFNVYTDETAE